MSHLLNESRHEGVNFSGTLLFDVDYAVLDVPADRPLQASRQVKVDFQQRLVDTVECAPYQVFLIQIP